MVTRLAGGGVQVTLSKVRALKTQVVDMVRVLDLDLSTAAMAHVYLVLLPSSLLPAPSSLACARMRRPCRAAHVLVACWGWGWGRARAPALPALPAEPRVMLGMWRR